MATARFDEAISDEKIMEKLSQFSNTAGSAERKLIRWDVPNEFGTLRKGHTVYILNGSPLKAFAVRKKNTLYFYRGNGERAATYQLNTRGEAINHDISMSREELEENWAEVRKERSDVDVEEEVIQEIVDETSLHDHTIDPQELIDDIGIDVDLEEFDSFNETPGRAPSEPWINMLNKISTFVLEGYTPFKVLRPYDAEFDEISELVSICDKYGCEFKIVGASNYFEDYEDYEEITFSIILAK